MRFTTFATLVVGLVPVLAELGQSRSERCGSHPSEAQVKLSEASFRAKKKSSKALGGTPNVVIPVHWHAVQSGDSLLQGHIPESQVADSIKVLNEDYALTGFSFKLESGRYYTNSTWFNRAGPDRGEVEGIYQTEMKQTLRRGNNATTLNIFSVGFTNIVTTGLLGYATFPTDYTTDPQDDGVVIRYSTVPGGSNAPKAALARVTLSMTPQLNSTKPKVAQLSLPTAAQVSQVATLHLRIHNFMDYSDDICLTEFTPGQILRMQEMFMTFRVGTA
ncbi:Extracellular metalloprotease MGYG_00389 [Rhizoctonia solani AG-1 IB]|uniref:Extracellular metalloprotease MGYG_00389 n=1 Tax=Thanatephorus cucumeris (strain AG1-IB / isolate 7/3/14) TaxID=1108050 RepID=M5C2A5_THACB|nr:Extracellular metalloprotease MGYG_00389 [Rhizoctonia solani AG-1 IB]